MPFKIVRNDITKMNTEAIVNTANDHPTVGTGCDYAVYMAAGYEELLAYRRENIGYVKEGDVFITPGFHLPAQYIIHAVSPLYVDGRHDEEALLRSCYRKSLALAAQRGISSIAFPLISTGGFGYPKEEGMRIAVDEIHAFLLHSDMQVCLVVFDEKAAAMGRNLYPDLEAYIDLNYVQERNEEEYGSFKSLRISAAQREARLREENLREASLRDFILGEPILGASSPGAPNLGKPSLEKPDVCGVMMAAPEEDHGAEEIERRLAERMAHMADSFSQYLLYLIEQKGMENADVYKRAIVDKKVFSKIKNNPQYHPQKMTALCLCIGARLNLDESRDLLARAGYALSPCDKTDIIFSYFIEHGIYDMIDLDIQLEEHGLPCIIA